MLKRYSQMVVVEGGSCSDSFIGLGKSHGWT